MMKKEYNESYKMLQGIGYGEVCKREAYDYYVVRE